MTELVGRTEVIDEVQRAIAGVQRGRGGALVVTGPAGGGRTAVLRQAAALAAAAGLRVEVATPGPLDAEVGLGVVRRLLQPVVADHPDLLSSGLAALAEPLFVPHRTEVDPAAVALGLEFLVDAASERLGGLVLVVDDLGWVDASSLGALEVLAELTSTVPLLLIVAGADTDGASLATALTPSASVVSAGPLDGAEVAELAAGSLEGPVHLAFADALSILTGGLPGLLVPLLELAAARGLVGSADDVGELDVLVPPTLPHQVARRLGSRSAPARSAALAASVIGVEMRLDVLCAAAELEAGELRAAVAELVDAGLFRAGSRPAWAVPLVGRATRALVGEGTAGLVAVRAAAARSGAGDPVEDVAALLVGAPAVGEPWAADALAAAATAAEGRGAPAVARTLWLRHLEEPLEFTARGWSLAAVARAELHLGDPQGIDRLEGLCAVVEDPGLRALARFAASRAALWQGWTEHAVLGFEQAAIDAEAVGATDVVRRARAGALLASAIGADEPAAAERAARPGWAPAPGADDAPSSSLAGAQALAALVRGAPADEVAEAATAVLADDRLYVLPTSDFTALTAAAVALGAAGHPGPAVAALDRLIATARGIGQISTAATVEAARSVLLLAAGRVDDALASAVAALDAPHANPIELPSAGAVAAEAHLAQGDVVAARAALDRVPGPDPDARPRLAELRWLAAAARVALAEERPDLALAHVDRLHAAGAVGRLFAADELAARSLVALGRRDEARGRAEAAAVEATAVARSAVRRGRAQVLAGRLAGAPDRLAGGVDLLRQGSEPLELAVALVDLGRELARTGARTEARATCREALDLAERLGAGGVAAEAEGTYRLAGGRPRRRALTGVEALTPAEERICRLVVGGRSNREVAEALYLSRKTVEYHLGNAYGKLGIIGRDGLRRALAG